MKHPMSSRHPRQRGVVLLFCLVILVVLLAGGVAVMRSMNATLFSAGNLAFKRDLVNQGEQAISNVLTRFRTGNLSSAAAAAANLQAANYSAATLSTNPKGIPLALLNDTTFATVGTTANDITVGSANDMKIRYVIDRLCNAVGTPTALGTSGCVYTPSTTEVTGGSSQRAREDLPSPPALVYRLSVRVDGPRNTQVFLQTSFTNPDQ